MPTVSTTSVTESSSSGTVYVINGLDSTGMALPKGAASHRSNTITTSSSSPLLTLVPSLQPRVVVSTTGNESSSPSPGDLAPKSTILAATDSPQIIVVSEGDGSLDSTSNGNGSQTVNIGGSTYVQYVEGSDQQTLFSNSNGQIAYPVYTVGDTTMYAASPTYYTTTGTTPVTYTQVNSQEEVTNSPVGGPILTSGNSTIILHHQDVEIEQQQMITPSRHSPQTQEVAYMVGGSSTANGGGGMTPQLDADAQATIAHATRVSPMTVQWLLDNYETSEGVSLPRSTLYNHYLYHCNDHKLDPVNSASFGKLIRSVFTGLRTRRLGTRGNSKYHYYGIRVKPNSNLNQLSEEGTPIVHNQLTPPKKGTASQEASPGSQGTPGKAVAAGKNSDSFDSNIAIASEQSPQTLHNQQFLGEVSRALPHVPDLVCTGPLPAGVTRNHLETFKSMYQDHCESILEIIYSLQFPYMETVWRRFWGLQGNNNNNVISEDKSDISDEEDGELASKFSPNVLNNLLCYQPVLDMMKVVDYEFYQNIVKVLVPDVLRSIPPTLTQSIRNFAKSLEGWLCNALTNYPAEVIQVKINAVSSLAQTLRRYTSLNHLAQAARAVLQNSAQINQMLSDLNRVDFHNVQEQASWVCQCDVGIVQRLEADFKNTLQQQNSLEQWAEWLRGVVDQILTPEESNPDFAKHARQFLLKWSFYSSMVIRDLTLRSAASFGSFHLIRLLYDEYMFYLVEHKVAESMGQTPIAVMSQYLGTMKTPAVGSNLNGDSSAPKVKRLKFEDS